ncbi:hypothetical protein K491DRAFT_708071 [Lophiostoma macrostomum CBS 122681]|uniref:DUF7703 domain-containing protein n=1 Tax=Lophiostoma macrostomum CBS 122681 TaxID=1314788 RepID=A0A6A6SRC6_9PLEO|nr:hypothetical protein K491DRAFT_708071 [Lophiostoma macrostomum CBS 122681]
MDTVQHLKDDLPVAMTMAAFVGISWYICVETNIRLFVTFARRRGLYFWSCLLCSWGVLIQPLATILTDFAMWKDKYVAMVVIYVSWWIMVVPQSFVLYSRLYLVMHNQVRLRCVLYFIMFNSVVFSVPTMVMGILAQTSMSATLGAPYLVWDKLQLTVFFVQETILSMLYILETRKRLQNSTKVRQDDKSREVFKHLIYINIFVILLDCSLLGLSYANLFYVQSAYKPCVYGVKLRVEFAVLNRLISSVQSASHSSYGHGDGCKSSSHRSERSHTEIMDNHETSSEADPDYDGRGILQTTEISVLPCYQEAHIVGKG